MNSTCTSERPHSTVCTQDRKIEDKNSNPQLVPTNIGSEEGEYLSHRFSGTSRTSEKNLKKKTEEIAVFLGTYKVPWILENPQSQTSKDYIQPVYFCGLIIC